ncbi:hypothetical protein FH972_027194 [Carpinus fangiana]|uniref:Uncharacterized protein n=1 Tax=Carpinus fangiana TaxID=176857 RepID=A0A5N6L6C1_9ROSI|nr:hypothetical protein FH972_027194 [Carpinus fangiana]
MGKMGGKIPPPQYVHSSTVEFPKLSTDQLSHGYSRLTLISAGIKVLAATFQLCAGLQYRVFAHSL